MFGSLSDPVMSLNYFGAHDGFAYLDVVKTPHSQGLDQSSVCVREYRIIHRNIGGVL